MNKFQYKWLLDWCQCGNHCGPFPMEKLKFCVWSWVNLFSPKQLYTPLLFYMNILMYRQSIRGSWHTRLWMTSVNWSLFLLQTLQDQEQGWGWCGRSQHGVEALPFLDIAFQISAAVGEGVLFRAWWQVERKIWHLLACVFEGWTAEEAATALPLLDLERQP